MNLCGETKIASMRSSRSAGMHVDGHVGGRGGVVEAGVGAGAVQRRGRCGAHRSSMPVTFEAAENAPIFEAARSAYERELRLEVGESRAAPAFVEPTSTTVATDSTQGSSLEWCSYGPTNTTGRRPRGCATSSENSRSSGSAMRRPEKPDQLVDRGRRAGADEDHDVVAAGVDRATYDLSRLLAQLAHDAARSTRPRCGCCRR